MVLCVHYSEEFTQENTQVLNMLAQGPSLPTILLGVQGFLKINKNMFLEFDIKYLKILGLLELPPSKQMAARRDVLKRFTSLNFLSINKMKTFPLDTKTDVSALLRQASLVKKTLRVHKNRPFMLAEKIAIENDRLKISGWLSTAMSVNLPMHIPGVGNFLLSHVENESGEILIKATDSKQPELNPEAEVDMLDAEQTFPTEEEIEMEQNKPEIRHKGGFKYFKSINLMFGPKFVTTRNDFVR